MSDQSNSVDNVSKTTNNNLLNEIKQLKEKMKTLVDQMANQSKVVQHLRQEVENLKRSESPPKDLNASEVSNLIHYSKGS